MDKIKAQNKELSDQLKKLERVPEGDDAQYIKELEKFNWDLKKADFSPEAQAVRPDDVNPLMERKERLEYYKQNLLDESGGCLHHGGKRLLDKWTFEIKKLESILSDEGVKND